MYPTCTTTADVLEEIFSQQRGHNESLVDFIRRMSGIGRRARVPDHDLAQYTMKRLNHNQFSTAVGCVKIQSMNGLLEAAIQFNQNNPSSSKSATSSRSASKPSTNTQPSSEQPYTARASSTNQQRATPATTARATKTPTSNTKCWNCKAVGHTLHSCPHPKMKCGNCHRFGHEAKECRSDTRAEPVRRIDTDDDDDTDEDEEEAAGVENKSPSTRWQ